MLFRSLPGLREERLEVGAGDEVTIELTLCVAREPADHLVEFGLGATLALDLRDVQRVDAGDAGAVDAVTAQAVSRSSDTTMPGSDTHG